MEVTNSPRRGKLQIKPVSSDTSPAEDFDKSIPYIRERDGTSRNSNGKADQSEFNDNPIVCADLSADYLEQAKTGRIDMTRYADPATIERNIDHKSMHEKYLSFEQENHPRRISTCDKFGSHISDAFTTMSVPAKKFFMLRSGGHAMVVWLETKVDINTTKYKVHFYDPNVSNVDVRCERTGAHSFSEQCLKDYFPEAEQYNIAFPQDQEVFLMIDCTEPPGEFEFPLEGVMEVPVSATAAFLLLLVDHEDSVTMLQKMQDREGKEIFDFLSTPAGPRNDQLGHVIMSWCSVGKSTHLPLWASLLRKLQYEEQLELLGSKTSKGLSPLACAMRSNGAQNVVYYGQIISELIKEADRSKLVHTRVGHLHVLDKAIELGSAKCIKAWFSLLQLLPRDLRVVPSTLMRSIGPTGLHKAVRENNHMLQAWKVALPLFDFQQGSTLLMMSPLDKGNLPFHQFLLSGNASAMRTWIEMVQIFLREWKCDKDLHLYLPFPDVASHCGLPAAISDKAERVAALAELVALNPDENQRYFAWINGAMKALVEAMQSGKADCVQAWVVGTKSLFLQEIQLEVLERTDWHSGFFDALAKGHAETVSAWLGLAEALPEHSRIVFIKKLDNALPDVFEDAARELYAQSTALYR
jgi:hypothetical protein